MQLDCPETGIIHLYQLVKKVVCIDCLFKCPDYAAWKSYDDDDLKLFIISACWHKEGVVESETHRERVLHASLSSHQGNCTVCSDWTAPCGEKDSAYCLEPGHALWNKIYHVSILDRFRSVAFTFDMKKIFL